jgi:ankyrin repeat protein
MLAALAAAACSYATTNGKPREGVDLVSLAVKKHPGFNVTQILFELLTSDVAPTRVALDALLAQGALINARHADSTSLLHVAAARGRVPAVQWLLDNGASVAVELPDANGKRPVDLAPPGSAAQAILLAFTAKRNYPRSGSNARQSPSRCLESSRLTSPMRSFAHRSS